jgi:hypothetical protein
MKVSPDTINVKVGLITLSSIMVALAAYTLPVAL